MFIVIYDIISSKVSSLVMLYPKVKLSAQCIFVVFLSTNCIRLWGRNVYIFCRKIHLA